MKIHHAALYVRNLEAAKDFFCHYFSAKPSALYHNQRTTFKSYFLHFDGTTALEIMTRDDLSGDVPADKTPGFTHLCFALGSREAVDAKMAQLQQGGFALLNGPRVTGDGFYEAVIAGPEGNLIELTV